MQQLYNRVLTTPESNRIDGIYKVDFCLFVQGKETDSNGTYFLSPLILFSKRQNYRDKNSNARGGGQVWLHKEVPWGDVSWLWY